MKKTSMFIAMFAVMVGLGAAAQAEDIGFNFDGTKGVKTSLGRETLVFKGVTRSTGAYESQPEGIISENVNKDWWDTILPGGNKDLNVCGYSMKVPLWSYVACQGSAAMLPADCTAGAAVTGGGACAANIGIVAASCAVNVATVSQMAACCIKGGC